MLKTELVIISYICLSVLYSAIKRSKWRKENNFLSLVILYVVDSTEENSSDDPFR